MVSDRQADGQTDGRTDGPANRLTLLYRCMDAFRKIALSNEPQTIDIWSQHPEVMHDTFFSKPLKMTTDCLDSHECSKAS